MAQYLVVTYGTNNVISRNMALSSKELSMIVCGYNYHHLDALYIVR
jgi:hypothetical protein